LLADSLLYVETTAIPDPLLDLPACRDLRDQVFLVFANSAQVDALVTGGADFLAPRMTFPHPSSRPTS
jgi:predicted nucleic acid-binding protein